VACFTAANVALLDAPAPAADDHEATGSALRGVVAPVSEHATEKESTRAEAGNAK